MTKKTIDYSVVYKLGHYYVIFEESINGVLGHYYSMDRIELGKVFGVTYEECRSRVREVAKVNLGKDTRLVATTLSIEGFQGTDDDTAFNFEYMNLRNLIGETRNALEDVDMSVDNLKQLVDLNTSVIKNRISILDGKTTGCVKTYIEIIEELKNIKLISCVGVIVSAFVGIVLLLSMFF